MLSDSRSRRPSRAFDTVIFVTPAAFATSWSVTALPPPRRRRAAGSSGLGAATRIDLGTLDLSEGVSVELAGIRLPVLDAAEAVFDVLDRAEIAFSDKESAYAVVQRLRGRARVEALHALEMPGNLFGALMERLPDDR